MDNAANLWFLSARTRQQNRPISRHPQVQLMFANPGASEFLSLQGRAFGSDSRPLCETYWNPLASAWFPGGIDDPELTVIRVQAQSGHYWATEFGKTVTLLLVAVGALTGKPMPIGIQGDVRP